MEIILLQDMRNLGHRGEVVRVKPGYARNYLIPQGIALLATKGNRAYFDQQRKKIDARHSQEVNSARAMAEELAGMTVTVAKRVGDRDTLYGSVTTSDVAEMLAAKGVTVDRRRIDLGGPVALKSLGDHTVSIDLHPEVTAEVTVSVVAAN